MKGTLTVITSNVNGLHSLSKIITLGYKTKL